MYPNLAISFTLWIHKGDDKIGLPIISAAPNKNGRK